MPESEVPHADDGGRAMRPPLRVRDVSDGYVPLVSDGPDCPRCRLPWALHPTRDGEPWCRDFYARGASVPAWGGGGRRGGGGPLMRPEGNGPKPLSSGPGISPEGVT